MSPGRRLAYILLSLFILLVAGYFIYTGTQMDIEGVSEMAGALND